MAHEFNIVNGKLCAHEKKKSNFTYKMIISALVRNLGMKLWGYNRQRVL